MQYIQRRLAGVLLDAARHLPAVVVRDLGVPAKPLFSAGCSRKPATYCSKTLAFRHAYAAILAHSLTRCALRSSSTRSWLPPNFHAVNERELAVSGIRRNVCMSQTMDNVRPGELTRPSILFRYSSTVAGLGHVPSQGVHTSCRRLPSVRVVRQALRQMVSRSMVRIPRARSR